MKNLINRIAFKIPPNVERMIFTTEYVYALNYEDNLITVYEYKENK